MSLFAALLLFMTYIIGLSAGLIKRATPQVSQLGIQYFGHEPNTTKSTAGDSAAFTFEFVDTSSSFVASPCDFHATTSGSGPPIPVGEYNACTHGFYNYGFASWNSNDDFMLALRHTVITSSASVYFRQCTIPMSALKYTYTAQATDCTVIRAPEDLAYGDQDDPALLQQQANNGGK